MREPPAAKDPSACFDHETLRLVVEHASPVGCRRRPGGRNDRSDARTYGDIPRSMSAATILWDVLGLIFRS